jgi:hypothetical protein
MTANCLASELRSNHACLRGARQVGLSAGKTEILLPGWSVSRLANRPAFPVKSSGVSPPMLCIGKKYVDFFPGFWTQQFWPSVSLSVQDCSSVSSRFSDHAALMLGWVA